MAINHRLHGFEYPIPDGFRDDSNGNDICASIYSKALGVKIFIDRANPDEREEPNYSRFSVYKTNSYGEIEDHIAGLVIESESWLPITEKIESLQLGLLNE